MAGRRRTTMNDIARAAGVSSAAVSYALTGQPGVSPELRDRIRTIADELGYRPSLLARGLKVGHTHSIGLLLADITNPFYTEMTAGAVEAAAAAGYEVLISHLGPEGPGERPAERLAAAARTHVDRACAGLALTSLTDADRPLLNELRRAGVPVVQLYRRVEVEPSDWVGIDDRSAAREIATRLVGTGRRRVAVLGGPRSSSASTARGLGFRDALEAAGLAPVNHEALLWGDITRRSGLERARRLFRDGVEFDAVACGNDLIALGVLDACREAGRAVPADVAVTGFDDMSFADVGPLSLSTVFVPREAIGRRGVQLLLHRIEGADDPPRREVLPHELRLRGTTP